MSLVAPGEAKPITEVDGSIGQPQPTTIPELDRVLGGGITRGSCILLGGDPGIGKSTILLQMLCQLPQKTSSLYVSGEESQDQLGMRAKRLGLQDESCYVMSETRLDSIIDAIVKLSPEMVVIDSIQTLFDEKITSASGSVAQIRECTHQLLRFCKARAITLFVIGHVTKEGALAGPRVLEHMVDTVLYFEGERSSRHRIIRSVKNRFGPAHEIGLFMMTQTGLKAVSNPSRMFLQEGPLSSGRVVTALWEGTRTMLVEIQVLVSPSYGDNPRRVCVGFDTGRLNMLLAIASRCLHIKIHTLDVYVNVVGGIKITEPSADLAVIAALISSHRNIILGGQLMAFGEIGLGGEIRPVHEGDARIMEAHKQGFTTIWAPNRNKSRTPGVVPLGHIQDIPLSKLD
jgi:DNA repair protein RadA/Sms